MVTIISILAVMSGILIGVIFSNIRNLDKISKLVKRIETLEKLSIVTDDTAHSASEAVSSGHLKLGKNKKRQLMRLRK